MKEYRVIKASLGEAERIMNDMARQGWNLKSTTYWAYWWIHMVLTFERTV